MGWQLSAIALLVCGCPPTKGQGPISAECTKEGASCELSPGKLGTCVSKVNCSESNCLVCQSQH
jgi:hypothetical protein